MDLSHEYIGVAVPRKLMAFVRHAGTFHGMGVENAEKEYFTNFSGPEKTGRGFIGNIKCKIIGVEKDTKTMRVTLDMVYIE